MWTIHVTAAAKHAGYEWGRNAQSNMARSKSGKDLLDKIDKIYSAARESMQIRIYGNRHDGSKVLNGAVTVQLDDDPE